MDHIALVATAILLGGMTFFSFGFAPVLFKLLPSGEVRKVLRGTFPYYYLVVAALSLVCVPLAWSQDRTPALLLLLIAASTICAREILMPKINAAADRADKLAFGMLHGLSVVIQLIQLGLCGWALLLL